MGCGDFQQIRIAEFFNVKFDSAGELEAGAFDLSQAIDVGPYKTITITILVLNSSFGTGVTGVRFNSQTAAINNKTYYATTSDSIVLDEEADEGPIVWTGTFEMLSRFWLPDWSIIGSPSTATSLSCTIDIVARG